MSRTRFQTPEKLTTTMSYTFTCEIQRTYWICEIDELTAAGFFVFLHFLPFLYVQTWVFRHSCNAFTEETKQLILKCKDVISLNHVTVISLSNNFHQQVSPGKCRPACGERWEVTVQIFEHYRSDLSSSSLLFSTYLNNDYNPKKPPKMSALKN